MLVAHYSKMRLLGLALIGCLFVACGIWMVMQPDGAFDHSRRIHFVALFTGGNNDLAGHAVGVICALLGFSAIPLAVRLFFRSEPAVRVDQEGVYWHRWSEKPIVWSNIADVGERAVRRQFYATLTLRDPSLDRPRKSNSALRFLNSAVGFGDVSITTAGLDLSHADLLHAIRSGMLDHAQAPVMASRRSSPAADGVPMPGAAPARPTFGRKQA